jgi:hypothetical protein
MLRSVTVAFYLLIAAPTVAQISISEFLASALRDDDVLTYKEQIRYLDQKPYRLSPLQRLEFRTQNRELQETQQEFALRLTPSNPWEVKNNNRYFQSYRDLLALQNEIALTEALTDRYNAVINFVFLKDLQKLIDQRRGLVEDQLSILEQQAGSRFFDADDYVDLQVDLMDRTVEADETSFELLTATTRIQQLLGRPITDSLSWSDQDLIPLPGIIRITDSLSADGIASLNVNYQKQKIEVARRELNLERSNINVGFLQGEFDNRRQDQGRTPFNISLGITIPIVNPNKVDMAKRQLDIIETEMEFDQTRRDSDIEREILQTKTERLIRRFDDLSRKLSDYEAGMFSSTLREIESGNPRVVVSMNENIIKLKVLLLRVKRDILLSFVEELAFNSTLQRQPLINFISRDLRPIR